MPSLVQGETDTRYRLKDEQQQEQIRQQHEVDEQQQEQIEDVQQQLGAQKLRHRPRVLRL